ncbi:transcriptional regulator, MerR family [Candidatus Rhodobacter oscarellae]|uniref:Transcriptional regulator, MerR family n=1 Tax=Candidatus Rhodobacter oscarellae TaxID=1675527 RepID=A0A0J9E458_9RHOB|nr:MerR family transcriptional regulator [Candidatus Rhodobacter lobularis]KMW57555.1 transcriptional regulator, MerR family [Candidatus Rhodobacter lobularis]
MQIAEAAAESGLSIDTIRFYERSGMLPPLARDARGWRQFSGDALDWLRVLGNLRKTGMPLEDVRRFAASANGPLAETQAAMAERLAILRAHAARLEAKRAEIETCSAYLDHKIAIYSGMGVPQ